MLLWQKIFIGFYGILALTGFVKGYIQCKKKNNVFGLANIYNLIGAFVWGDAVVFGLFWALVCLSVLILNDWILFLLFVSVFWLIRSFGETTYWFNQQFSNLKRNPPENFWFFKIFKNDSVWFINQIFWQCIAVVTVITTIYLTKIWLDAI